MVESMAIYPMVYWRFIWVAIGLFGRFLAVAYGPIQSRFQTIKPSIIEAARGLGAGPKRLVWRFIYRY
ncbi:hypothetical protein THIOSC15_2990009 [uncultured Thiomicrorhabdus sp.]